MQFDLLTTALIALDTMMLGFLLGILVVDNAAESVRPRCPTCGCRTEGIEGRCRICGTPLTRKQ